MVEYLNYILLLTDTPLNMKNQTVFGDIFRTEYLLISFFIILIIVSIKKKKKLKDLSNNISLCYFKLLSL